jgi:hypothetical protein
MVLTGGPDLHRCIFCAEMELGCLVNPDLNPERKFETNIAAKGIARPQSQFPHSWVCERFIYSQDGCAYSAAGKYADRSWEYISRSQTHECDN